MKKIIFILSIIVSQVLCAQDESTIETQDLDSADFSFDSSTYFPFLSRDGVTAEVMTFWRLKRAILGWDESSRSQARDSLGMGELNNVTFNKVKVNGTIDDPTDLTTKGYVDGLLTGSGTGNVSTSGLTNNRLVTASGANTVNDDPNLTWESSVLGVVGTVDVTGSVDIDNNLNIGGLLSITTTGPVIQLQGGTDDLATIKLANDAREHRLQINGADGFQIRDFTESHTFFRYSGGVNSDLLLDPSGTGSVIADSDVNISGNLNGTNTRLNIDNPSTQNGGTHHIIQASSGSGTSNNSAVLTVKSGRGSSGGGTDILSVENNSTVIFRITASENIYSIPTYSGTVGGTNRDLFIDDNGKIGYVSSIRESKQNIVTLEKVDWISDLRPVSYNYRKKNDSGEYTDDYYEEIEYGLIAEEVVQVNPELVFYDILDDGTTKELRGVSYDKLIVPLLKKIQELELRIEVLENE